VNLEFVDPRTLFDTVARPSDFVLLFEAAFWVCGIAGVALGSKLKPLLIRNIVFALVAILLTFGASEFSRHYVVSFERDMGCTSAPDEGYVTMVPLFAPARVNSSLPTNSGFDALSCEAYQDQIDRHAAMGFYSSLALYLAMLCIAYTLLPLLLLQTYKAVRLKLSKA